MAHPRARSRADPLGAMVAEAHALTHQVVRVSPQLNQSEVGEGEKLLGRLPAQVGLKNRTVGRDRRGGNSLYTQPHQVVVGGRFSGRLGMAIVSIIGTPPRPAVN